MAISARPNHLSLVGNHPLHPAAGLAQREWQVLLEGTREMKFKNL